jgi:hypothetical protein
MSFSSSTQQDKIGKFIKANKISDELALENILWAFENTDRVQFIISQEWTDGTRIIIARRPALSIFIGDYGVVQAHSYYTINEQIITPKQAYKIINVTLGYNLNLHNMSFDGDDKRNEKFPEVRPIQYVLKD